MKLAVLCIPFVLLACGTSDENTSDGGVTSVPGGPRIVSFASNTTQLGAATDQLTISAILTDVDGIDDIIGGQLFDADSGVAYGAFATAAQEGAYSITLTWAQLTQPRADVPGAWNTPVSINLRGKFFDQAAHEATQTLTIKLACGDTQGTIGRVIKSGCDVGALCGPELPDGVGGGKCPEGETCEPTVDCYLAPQGASGAAACQGWNGMTCDACRNRNSGTSLACNQAAATSYGATCTCS